MHTLTRTSAIAGAVLAAALVAPPPAQAVTTKVVSMTGGNAFSPDPVRVVKGSVVRWKNTGFSVHTSTSDTGLWNSGNVAPGGTFSRTFNRVGKFAYHCTKHVGMDSVVIVRSP